MRVARIDSGGLWLSVPMDLAVAAMAAWLVAPPVQRALVTDAGLASGFATGIVALGWLFVVALLFATSTCGPYRLRVDATGVAHLRWAGWRRIDWPEVTSASLLFMGKNGVGLEVRAGDGRRIRIRLFSFIDPRGLYDEIASRLPVEVQAGPAAREQLGRRA